MAWTVEFDAGVTKDLKPIPVSDQRKILDFLANKVDKSDNPFIIAKALKGNHGLWRYRVGNYRIICSFSKSLVVKVITIRNRKNAYER